MHTEEPTMAPDAQDGFGGTIQISRSACRLIILDDDPLVGDTIVNMACASGIEAEYVADANALYRRIGEWNPTHIALDLIMPGNDGISVIKRLSEIGCNSGIIIISGIGTRVMDAAQRSAKEHGLTILGTLSKPFSGKALGALLKLTPPAATERAAQSTCVRNSIDADRLRTALDKGEIGPAFQPKVRCADGSLAGFEALARWQVDGTVYSTPDIFIPIAEQSGQMDRLTEVILQNGLAWLANHFKHAEHTLAVNVSAYSLNRDSILDLFQTASDRYDIALSRIVVEITESGAVDQQTNTLDILTRMRLNGMHLSIDDFGVGYSSLVQLARLPFSELKIDRSFVRDLVHSSEARAIVSATIGMARGLGMRTVAEGVEDIETFWQLKELGCDVAQGYFIGRPMKPDAAVQWTDIS